MNHHRLDDYQAFVSDSAAAGQNREIEEQAAKYLQDHHDYADEKALFRLIASGDESAFRRLFDLYAPLFIALIRKILKDDTIAEDLLQDVFLKIWLKRESLTTIENPRSWALQIVYHIAFNRLRHLKVVAKSGAYSEQKEAVSNAVEDSLYHAETSGHVRNAIGKLSPQTRKIYLLNREEGIKITEIARQLQLSNQTVKNTLGKAVREIRAYLVRQGITRM